MATLDMSKGSTSQGTSKLAKEGGCIKLRAQLTNSKLTRENLHPSFHFLKLVKEREWKGKSNPKSFVVATTNVICSSFGIRKVNYH